MTDATARIKNLSIALTQLSGTTHKDICYGIRELLVQEIQKQAEKKGLPSARPAKTSPDNPLFNT